MLVHVHGRQVSIQVWIDRNFFRRPGLTVILASINCQRSRRVFVFDEYQNISRCFIDRRSPALKSRPGNDNFISPRLATIFAAPSTNSVVAPRCENCSLQRDNNVRETFVAKELLHRHLRLAEKWLK